MRNRRSHRQTTRERLFTKGADALQRTVLTAPYGYGCPACMRGFPRTALYEDMLTLEHAPPDSLGGMQSLLLTCRMCNSSAGHSVDTHMHRMQQLYDFAAGTMTRPARAHLNVGSARLNVKVFAEGRNVKIAAPTRANRPGAESVVTTELQRQANGQRDACSLRLHFYQGFRYRDALVGWLRAAYLVAFAKLGYRYILKPDLRIVRQQLADPKAELLRVFSLAVPAASSRERRLLLVEAPAEIESIGVQMGPQMIILPSPWSSSDLYEDLGERAERKANEQITGKLIPWPKQPEYVLDFVT